MIGTKTGQANYRSCRRRCIETTGCNYWSFVNKKSTDTTLIRNCYLYSSITGYNTGTDNGRISGDLACPAAMALIACCRTTILPCCTPCENYDTCDEVSIPSVKGNSMEMNFFKTICQNNTCFVTNRTQTQIL